VPGTEGVATTVSFDPVIPVPGPLKPAGPVEPLLLVDVPVLLEDEAVYTLLLLPESVELQPDSQASETTQRSNDR